MSALRVFIVDDSVVVRRVVAKVIEGEPGLEVAGTARNGKVALSKIPDAGPDVVVLDVEMPEMNGLETLRVLREQRPELAVVMFSSLTKRGAETTLDALELGASDYVAKPGTTEGLSETQALIREELVPKVRALDARQAASGPEATPTRAASAHRAPATRRPTSGSGRPVSSGSGIDVVAIGASTGGPNALGTLLPALPADFPVPVVVVQHMPPVFTQSLADRLNGKSALDVREGSDGDVLSPGGVWIAPGDAHMELVRAGSAVQVRTHQGPPQNSCRPSVDVLFASVPAVYGPRVLGVMLTGMGKDGLRGARRIAEAGGQIVAQDEASSVVWGMPGAVSQAGLPEAVLPLNALAGELQRRATQQRRTRKVLS